MIRIRVDDFGTSSEAVLEGMVWRTDDSSLRERLSDFTSSALVPGDYVPDIEDAIVAYVSRFMGVTILERSKRSGGKPSDIY